jgi:hypothetical protein
MNTPALIFSFLVATFLGSAFHFWKGGSGGRLILNLILAWTGFFLGSWMGTSQDLLLLMIGPYSGGFGSLGSLILLFLGNWIISIDTK